MPRPIFGNDFTNYEYRAACGRGEYDQLPDCGHPDCGLQCDVAIVAARRRGELKAQYIEATEKPHTGGSHGRVAISGLLETGLDLRGVAAYLGVHVRQVTSRVLDADHHRVLAAEALLRQPFDSLGQVGRAVGLSHDQVGALAEFLGLRTRPQGRAAHVVQQEAAAAKYGDALCRIPELRGEGRSIRAIAVELGIPRSVVARRCVPSGTAGVPVAAPPSTVVA